MNDNKIPILSFFTGGGFMDMGFIKSGFDVLWTNEIDLSFAQFYKEGITSWKRKQGLIKGNIECNISNTNSIKELSVESIISEAFKGKKPKLFGIIGGPPCQDFSINGNLNGFQGDRGSLTDAYLYKILELQPAFFVMENVTGLIKVKKNADHFFELLRSLQDDYLIDWDVLNSMEFGVPQSRDRVFVIGISKRHFDLGAIVPSTSSNWFPFKKNVKYENPHSSYKWPHATPFGDDLVKPSELPLNLCVESCLVRREDEIDVANALEYFNLKGDKRRLKSIKEGETTRPSFKRLHRFKYSPTACYGNNEVHLHPYQHRRLSVRETLRIQGVDDSYILTTKGILSKKFKMIGNGVPVPLAAGVAKTLRDFLNNLTSS